MSVVDQALAAMSGPFGLVAVFGYSVLVAVVLPLPTELVLLAPVRLGLSSRAHFAIVILVAASGKALGSVLALRLGQGASHSGPVARLLAWIPRYERFRRRWLVDAVRRYRYLALTLVLGVPFMPDTAVLYAFSVLDGDARAFAAATFVGTVIRLVVALSLATVVVAVTPL